jgi:hypothetical protein
MNIPMHKIKDDKVRAVLDAAQKLKLRRESFDEHRDRYLFWSPICPSDQIPRDGRLEPVIPADGWGLDDNACLSLNNYNAICLNSRNLLILDIDLTEDTRLNKWAVRDSQEVIGRLHDLAYLDKRLDADSDDILAEICEEAGKREFAWAKQSWRIYTTRNGCRVICSSWPCSPDYHQFIPLCQFLGVDGRYAQKCLEQKCYRARLTRKPDEVDMAPVRFVGQVWTDDIHPELANQITLHDAICAPEIEREEEAEEDHAKA